MKVIDFRMPQARRTTMMEIPLITSTTLWVQALELLLTISQVRIKVASSTHVTIKLLPKNLFSPSHLNKQRMMPKSTYTFPTCKLLQIF